MVETFCTTCQRTTYVHEDGDPYCPVCSSPLVEINPESDSETG